MGKGRAPCCDKSQVKKGPWSPQEDLRLTTFIQKHGHTNWRSLPKQAGLLRCGKSCRLRWINYLRPDLKRGNFTKEEEESIIKLHQNLGNKWSQIASCLPGRTDNEIKNVWHTQLKKKLNKKEDHINQHNDETKKLGNSSSISSSFSFSSSSSTVSTLSPSRNQDNCDGTEDKKEENGESKENSSSSNSLTQMGYCSNSIVFDADYIQTEDTDFLVNNVYQEKYEMFMDPGQDIESLPLEIDYEFLEMLEKEDPFYTCQSQEKKFEICQSKFEEENGNESECMKWIKNLEKELLVETIGERDQNTPDDDACGQFLSSPYQPYNIGF